MPSGMAAEMREKMLTEDLSGLTLQTTPWSETGFVGVIKVKNKFQARVQVPGDGRGGMKKRRQHSLPGLFNTAKEAAELRAVVIRDMKESSGAVFVPPKQNKEHKTRKPAAAPKPQPLPPPQPLQLPMATAMAMPMLAPLPYVPFAAALSPVPMQPLGYTPPFAASFT